MPQGLASIERQDLRPLAVLVAFGVLLRVTVLLASTGILWPDTGLFVGSARSLLTDQPFSLHVYKTPLYPLFLSVFMWFGETHITGQAITVTQQLMGLASTLVFYLVARQVFGRTVALWSSLLFSAHTLQLFYELSVLSEALFVFLLAILIHQSMKAMRNPTWDTAAFVGLLSGLATLARPVAQAFVLVILAGVILGSGWRSQLRRALAAGVVMVVAYSAVVTPWMYVNFRRLGYFGVSLGHGFGLLTRVFMIDQAEPVPDTRYPDVK
ncbi:MAG TPA: glycosyltransferase family 39 protein, partial [Vicinamibacterales bacterium]|nr:glycosyltransferase family 39 protein [Vicinamibacterales bacterium]